MKVIHNDQRFALHAYNTTQNLMVQGKNCESFDINCLEPFFANKIESSLSKITQFNRDIEEQLTSKKSLFTI